MLHTKSFTLRFTGARASQLVTDCQLATAFDPSTVDPANLPPLHRFRAVWDTGAQASVITQDIVHACGLKPMGMVKVLGVGGVHVTETYLVNIMLPNGLGYPNVKVTRGDLTGFHALIGMDIISTGDFAITNRNGGTVFTFRTPSVAEFDFVKEHSAAVARLPKGGGGRGPGPGQSFHSQYKKHK